MINMYDKPVATNHKMIHHVILSLDALLSDCANELNVLFICRFHSTCIDHMKVNKKGILTSC